MFDTIIIGAGPAGLYAATLAGMHKLNTLVIESSFEYGGTLNLYKQKMVYDMPGISKISAGDLIENLYKQFKTYNDVIELRLNCKATDIHFFHDHYVLITNQGTFETKTLLLANGGGLFEPRRLELDGIDAMHNLYYNVKDVSVFKDQNLVVLGGGDSAVDWSLTLAEVAKKVTLIHRRDDFRAHEQSVDQVRDLGLVLTPYMPIAFKGYDKIDYLTIKNTITGEIMDIELDAIFVFHGSVASKNSIDKWGVEIENGLIKVSSNMETSKPNIFAIGNGITYKGKKKMIATALGEAATAINQISNTLFPNKVITYKH